MFRISRGISELFLSYFQERYQIVRINDTNSDLLPLKYGVPQGSILGPLLFNFYINDLAQLSLHSKIFQYADDTAVLLVSESYMDGIKLMQEDISKLITWFHSNFIFINHDKTQFTCFHSPYRKIDSLAELFLHGYPCNNCTCQSLNYLTKIKYLGLLLDDKFSFIHHIEHVARKLRAVCGVIYKLRTVCDVRLRKILYKSLGESILRYGITIYGWASKEKLNILNTIIRKIARNVVYGSTCSTAAIGDILCSHSMMSVQKLLVATLLTKHFF